MLFRSLVLLLLISPASQATELEARFAEAMTFAEFVTDLQDKEELWRRNTARAEIPGDVDQAMERVQGNWRFLAIADHNCSDSASTLPYLSALVDRHDNLELRLLFKPDAEDLLETRRAPDGRMAVPTIVLLDEAGQEAGCWIEHPAAQHDFWTTKMTGKLKPKKRARLHKQYMEWYEQDAGASTLRELLRLLESAEQGALGCDARTTPIGAR